MLKYTYHDLTATKWSHECKVQPKAHKAKTRCLKNKEYKQHSNNRIKYFNKFYQKKNFEIFKQEKFEDEQLLRYFLFQFQFHIVIKSGLTSTIAFHK